MLSERKGKRSSSKTASLNLGQKNPAPYLWCFYPTALSLCLFPSFLQHLMLPCLVSFPHLQAFCSTNPHSCADWQLWAASHFLICASQGSRCLHWYDSDGGQKGGCRGKRKHHLEALPSASCEGRTGNLLLPYKSLLGWTSTPGRQRVELQPSSLFSLQHSPSSHSLQLASSSH